MDKLNDLMKANRGNNAKIEFELSVLNNKSHFGTDESGFIFPIAFLLLVFIGIMVYAIMH